MKMMIYLYWDDGKGTQYLSGDRGNARVLNHVLHGKKSKDSIKIRKSNIYT